MDIETSATRPRDGEGAPGEALAVGESPVTVAGDAAPVRRLSPEDLAVVARAFRESAARMDAVHGVDLLLALARLEGRADDPFAAFTEYCSLTGGPREAR